MEETDLSGGESAKPDLPTVAAAPLSTPNLRRSEDRSTVVDDVVLKLTG
jgi:hypothetical protein